MGLIDKGQSEGEADRKEGDGNVGGGGDRSTIIITGGIYGSETFPPDSECDFCRNPAIGVLVMEKKMGDKGGKYGKPLCKYHWRQHKDGNVEPEGGFDFRRFSE